MAFYKVEHKGDGLVMVGFGDEAANNDLIVKEALILARGIVDELELHGKVVRINGAASLPVAMVLCKVFSGVALAVAAYDPKLQKYVVVVSNNRKYVIGDLID
jgi:CRISPR-associated protein Csx3